jgi:hypothetical protein
MKMNSNLEELVNDSKTKFTIILGSGFHKQGLKKDTILSSWEMLLRRLSPDCKLTGEYHLDFEKIIENKKISCEDSHDTEERLIQCVQKLIKEEQDKVIAEHANCYPIDIFNPKKVSDVISLNFDKIPEIILKSRDGIQFKENINDSSFSKLKNKDTKKSGSKDTYAYLSTKHNIVEFNDVEKISFWYPHGNIDNNNKIILGLHRYSQMLEVAIRLRNHHMQHKRSEQEDNTWYYRLIQNPVLILGAGLSSTEWDMWFALTSRNRANGDKLPVFQMRACECKNDAQHQWFEPLFTGMSFDQQWEKLEGLFKSK